MLAVRAQVHEQQPNGIVDGSGCRCKSRLFHFSVELPCPSGVHVSACALLTTAQPDGESKDARSGLMVAMFREVSPQTDFGGR